MLSHARHLLRGANARAKNYYHLAFVEEDVMEEEDEEENLDDVLEVKEKTIAAESSRKWDERRRKNLVNLLLEQETVTDI